MYDAIIVGAGWAGAVIAERLSDSNYKVLVIDKRDHIGGNCYDEIDLQTGILYHKYGPHIFHTDNEEVWKYLSLFTKWRLYEHKVLASIDGQYIPLPFNFNSIRKLFPERIANVIEDKLVSNFEFNKRIPILDLLKSKDDVVKKFADTVYEKVFLNYSAKQWGLKPQDLNKEVTSRVPISLSKDDRYFTDRWQFMPVNGYTAIFKQLLYNDNIHVMLNTDWHSVLEHDGNNFYFNEQKFCGTVFYSAMIDDLHNYRLGELPYRSLNFKYERLNQSKTLPVATVNYPNTGNMTRITEYKQLSGQDELSKTLLALEYPVEYNKNYYYSIPYYPVFTNDNQKLYNQYVEMSKKLNVILVGRLAEYKYYDQDDIIAKALEVSNKWINERASK